MGETNTFFLRRRRTRRILTAAAPLSWQGAGCPRGHGAYAVATALYDAAGRGDGTGGPERGRAAAAGRGPHRAGGQRPGRPAGRGVSAPGCLAVAPRRHRCRPRRSLLPAGPRPGPPPARQVLGTAGGAEPESAVAAAGQVPGRL